MFHHVLVPLDGSAEGERALPVAARIARASGGSVRLVRVVRAPVEFETGATSPAPWAPAARQGERDEAVAYLDAVRQRDALAGLSTTTAVYAGPPASMILMAAADAPTDLIVMTSHGRTGVSRWLLGSVASEVVRETAIPVLILRGSTLRDALEAQGGGLAALVPLDGSPLAEAAIGPALQLLGALASSGPVALHLLTIVEPLPLTETAPLAGGVQGEGHALLTALDKTMLGEAEEYLCSTAEQVQREATQIVPGHEVHITWSAVWSPDVAHAIAQIAASGRDDKGSAQQTSRLAPSQLIAMATHGYGGLRRWVMGSVAERVVTSASLPVLLVRPSGAGRPPQGRAE